MGAWFNSPRVSVVCLSALLGASAHGVAAGPVAWDPYFATPEVVAIIPPTALTNPAPRPFGVAAADFTGDGRVDVVIGRIDGRVFLVRQLEAGPGGEVGGFAAPEQLPWKQTTFNAWAFGAADVNGDGKMDVVWGAMADHAGCSVSPVPSTGCPSTVAVRDGEVRAFYGNGDGSFQETVYFVSGVRHNGGVLLADIGTDTGSLAAGDIDGDDDADVIAGALDGTNTVVRILRNDGGVFAMETVFAQVATTALSAPTYWPATSLQNSPWGLALGDADGDGDLDLWVGDRALYVYLYRNDGGGTFSLVTPNAALADRPNVYLRHDSFRPSTGYTPSLASGDINGDGSADLVLGLLSGAQTPAQGVAHDGALLLDSSNPGGHSLWGELTDIGTMARGVTVVDVNGDGALDVIAVEYDGKLVLVRQLPPIDTDGDGISDYVDNAPDTANAPRVDMNTDGAVNASDQLDNDFDTVTGNPEDPSTWRRLGDASDPDDDNDGVGDGVDNCVFVYNPTQANADADALGDACDPLDDRDRDEDGVPDGPALDDPLHAFARNAKVKWNSRPNRFLIRIDALSRFFQNEFTQLMTDAAILDSAEWAEKCWQDYEPGDITVDGQPYEPCGTGEGTAEQVLTLPGGKGVPIALAVIPKQLWTDPPVISWINDRNDVSTMEIVLHGTYHANNTPLGDWAGDAGRNYFSCELCGLTVAESFELTQVGAATLLGDYANRWVAHSGATPLSPAIDWASSANPLLSFSPPFNASDTRAREAIAQLGFRAFSASVYEEGPGFLGPVFSPEGSHHEQFDQYGMFHASADVQLDPPATVEGYYDPAEYESYLRSHTDEGGLTTWLIEEVDWSGRPCNEADRLGTCGGASNRENNTVYLPRWNAWLQVLDYVRHHGVAMTLGEVAAARAFDNAPTVENPDQQDADLDGIGDVIDDASAQAEDARLSRNGPGTLRATLRNGGDQPIPLQDVTFAFDTDGDGDEERYAATTRADGVAEVVVTPTRAVGPAPFTVDWDGVLAGAAATGQVLVLDTVTVTPSASNPASGQVTDFVTVAATLRDSSSEPVADRVLTFRIGAASAVGTTAADGVATATLLLVAPAGETGLEVAFHGDLLYPAVTASAPFLVLKEDTRLSVATLPATRNVPASLVATLTDADGTPVEGATVQFLTERPNERDSTLLLMGSAITGPSGTATFVVPARYVSTRDRMIKAVFEGDPGFNPAEATGTVLRQ